MTPLLFQAELAEKGFSSKDFSQSTVEIETLAVEAGWDPTWDCLYSSSRPTTCRDSSPAAAGTAVGGSTSSAAAASDIDAQLAHYRKVLEIKQLQSQIDNLSVAGGGPVVAVEAPAVTTAAVATLNEGGEITSDMLEQMATLARANALAAVGKN